MQNHMRLYVFADKRFQSLLYHIIVKKFDQIRRILIIQIILSFISYLLKSIGSAYVLFKDISLLLPQRTLATYHQLEI